MKVQKMFKIVVSAIFSIAMITGVTHAAELEEITVTARKIEENLQETPVAITALSADMIDELQLQDLSDISKVAAGLLFDNEFSRRSNRPVIRGQANILGSSGVSYFIDGVYISGSISDYDLNDIERIEVIKGPQSALYGRNTYSGAINLVTKTPEEAGGRLQIEAADDEQYELSASIRGKLGENASGGLNLRWFNAAGSFTNEFDGSDIGEQDSVSISGVLQFEPTENLDIRLRGYTSHLRDGQPALFAQDSTNNNCFADNGSLYGGLGRYYCGTVESQPINTDWKVQAPDAGLDADEIQLSLAVNYSPDENWMVTSITGFNSVDTRDVADGDYGPNSFQIANFTPGGFPLGFPFPTTFGYVPSSVDFTFASESDSEDISQEVRFNYQGEKFDALMGFYLFDQSEDTRNIRDLPAGAQATADANFEAIRQAELFNCFVNNPLCAFIIPLGGSTIAVNRNRSESDIENQAIFAMVNFDLSEDVGLSLEGRYQDETISQTLIDQPLGGAASTPVNSSATFSTFTPRVTVDWQVSEDNLLYLTYAEGTKPGGFNGSLAVLEGLPTFDEETVDSIEIGSKNVVMNGQGTVNVAVYYNEIEGYQLTQNVRSGANTLSATANAGSAEITGLELEANFQPDAIEGLAFTLNYAYTDAEFSEGFDQNQGVLNDALDNGLIDCSTGDEFTFDTGCTSAFGSIAGKKVPRTAENMAFFDVQYSAPTQTGSWFVGANLSYEDSKFAQVHNLAETGDTTLINARVGFNTQDYSVTLWGKNLGGEDSTPLVLRYADADGSFRRSFVGTQRRDSYFGITAAYNF